jgi:hypothetical protein
METSEIKEPIRNNLYWAKYWLNMKEKTGCNNFDENARQMRSKIFGLAWMTGEKTKEDEEVVKILDAILGDSAC